jgi:ATP-dependent Clp protease ATP-binding subunit ClpC
MFERFDEKARRMIFFARDEACQSGSSHIETEHLLLGLLREDEQIARRIGRGGATNESIRKRIEAERAAGEKLPTSLDIPLSAESKRALIFAAEEANLLPQKWIGTEQLLLGLLREEKSVASHILRDCQFDLSILHEELNRS